MVGQLKAYTKGLREWWNQLYNLFSGKLDYGGVQLSKDELSVGDEAWLQEDCT